MTRNDTLAVQAPRGERVPALVPHAPITRLPEDPMRAFHDDPAIKRMLLARCVTSRDSGGYRQGGCHDEHDMQIGCATAVMLQTRHPRLVDFEELFGLSYAFARNAEMLFEALPYKAATVFPEYAIAAIPVGADTRLIGWQLLHGTLADHEGAHHRIVAATVDDTLAFLAPLTVGEPVDIIDARERMMVAAAILKKAFEAAGGQNHSIWDAALLAKRALEAAATNDAMQVGNMVMRTTAIATRTPEGAMATARRMVALLAKTQPMSRRTGGERLPCISGPAGDNRKALGRIKVARLSVTELETIPDE